MRWNKIWSDSEYDATIVSRWFSPSELVLDNRAFWEDFEIACGIMWMRESGARKVPILVLCFGAKKARSLTLAKKPRIGAHGLEAYGTFCGTPYSRSDIFLVRIVE